jgi:malate dehydrogenase (oxaloacetate-decarboxylating)(NADP+)
MVTGVTRSFSNALDGVLRVIDRKPGQRVIGVSLILARGKPVIVADTAITELPSAEDLAQIAIEAAGVARRLGYEPRVAILASSNFDQPTGERAQQALKAVRILDQRRVDFEYDGQMGADVALNQEVMASYPFCRLTSPANVLIMPALHSAAISTRMVQELGAATTIGPLIVGLEKRVQIVTRGAKDSDIVNMAALASFNIGG